MFEQNKPRLAELAKSFLNSVAADRFLANPNLLARAHLEHSPKCVRERLTAAAPTWTIIVFHY
jgi:hypothetical protein